MVHKKKNSNLRTARSRDAHVRQFHSYVAVDGIDGVASSLSTNEQFQATALQLAPDSKNAGFVQPSFNSAFSRIVNKVCEMFFFFFFFVR